MAATFSLSLAAADILLEQARLGSAPFPFEVPHIGTTRTQRAQLREAVHRDLEAGGLMSGGRLDGGVEDALRLLTGAPVAIAAVAMLRDGERLLARSATDGQHAVQARQQGTMLVFDEVRPTAVVPTLVDLLPLTPAASGQSVTIPRPEPSRRRPAGGDGAYDPFAGVAPPRSHSVQARQVDRMFHGEKQRVGQFIPLLAAGGGRARPQHPLGWFDTAEGRYFMSVRDTDGQTWITYAPGDNARIAHYLGESLHGWL